MASLLRRILSPAFLALGLAACGAPDARGGGAAASGPELAERHCRSCHLLPDPALLDREAWERWVLPRMARRLGLQGVGWMGEEEPIEGGEGGRLVREAGVYPDTAQISYAEWQKLAAYYLESAPDSLPSPPPRPALAPEVPGFRVRLAEHRAAPAMVTLVQIEPALGRIYVGDATPGSDALIVLDARGREMERLPLPSAASHLRVAGDTLALLLMGFMHPSDAPRGSLGLLPTRQAGAALLQVAEGLRRPVFATYADLSGDGVEDVVVSEFGHLTGRLAWYQRLPGGGSRRHVLTPEPGALNTFAGDFDGDGRTDVLALSAQGNEGVSLFRGEPGGGFSRRWLIRFPPAFGSTSMELRDVDGDGDPDLVHTSGDAGDYPAPLKPYHGIRIFLNDGKLGFTERYFFPLHGAFKAVARDFDGDGDVDIAAIAFYPDYVSGAPESFVFLRNAGGLRFEPSTFPGADRGRWLVMDAGDVDRDGDDDLVLGSFARLEPERDPHRIAVQWRAPDAPAVVILENTAGRQ